MKIIPSEPQPWNRRRWPAIQECFDRNLPDMDVALIVVEPNADVFRAKFLGETPRDVFAIGRTHLAKLLPQLGLDAAVRARFEKIVLDDRYVPCLHVRDDEHVAIVPFLKVVAQA